MKKLLISAGAVTALALTSAPAFAQAVPATTQADAHVRIYQPLTLTSVRDLDLGTIVLNAGSYTDTVAISQAGVFSCGANVTCSGTTQTAQYEATGTQGQTLSVIVSSSIPLVNQTQASPDLTMTVFAPTAGSVVLDAAGEATFELGGSIQVSDTTPEGVYLGTFDVSADYQ